MKNKIKDFFVEVDVLLNNVPSLLVSFFFLSVVGMNLLANKSIDIKVDWLALDSAFLFSWLSFLTMDIITNRFGPKASTIISVLALFGNLICAFIFYLASVIPGEWSKIEDYEEQKIKDAINKSFNESFGSTYYIIIGSSMAYLSSSIINNVLNWLIGKCYKGNPNSFMAFALRSYISTAIGQFVDNFVFAIIVSKNFFGWSILKCIAASIAKMVAELLFEIIFSPLGYIYLKHMEKKNIGQQYLEIYQKEDIKVHLKKEEKEDNLEMQESTGNIMTELENNSIKLKK